MLEIDFIKKTINGNCKVINIKEKGLIKASIECGKYGDKYNI